MKAIILTDNKAGHENQSKALARGLGCEYAVVPVKFRNAFCKALSYLLDRVGVRTLKLFEPIDLPASSGAGKIDVVIGTGSGTFYAVKAVAASYDARTAIVLYPRGYRMMDFDCIMAPAFDRPAKSANVVAIPANLVAADEAFYAAGEAAFRKWYTPDPAKKACAIIVGGPNKCSTMTADWMKREMDRVFAETEGCERWLTTSRRTPPEVEKVLEGYPFDYALFYSRDHFNPIPAFVKLADAIYATAESTGMISEVCTFGHAEVHALDNLKPGKSKFRAFIEQLRGAGHIDGRAKIDMAPLFERTKRLLGV